MTLNILNSNVYYHAAQPNCFQLLSFFAGWLRRIGMLI
jgi:hypothetical protein